MADLSTHKIATFTGINDTPVEPTATKAGNGSHLIKKYNQGIYGKIPYNPLGKGSYTEEFSRIPE